MLIVPPLAVPMYIEPTVGSFFLQILVAIATALVLFFRAGIRFFRALVKKRKQPAEVESLGGARPRRDA